MKRKFDAINFEPKKAIQIITNFLTIFIKSSLNNALKIFLPATQKLVEASSSLTIQTLERPTKRAKKDEQAIRLPDFYDNFYSICQTTLNNFYLQPFSEGETSTQVISKSCLNDGRIEREIHGAIHASRVAAYIIILHEKLKKMFPDFVTTVIDNLSQDFLLNERQIILLASFAGLCHDSGRSNDGNDQPEWEYLSSVNCKHTLVKNNISENVAAIFSSIITYKDAPDDLKNFLTEKGLADSTISSLSYLRVLLYLADCFDLMRCVEEFQLKYILKGFATIKEFRKEEFFSSILELTHNIHQFIISQKDMIYSCKVTHHDKILINAEESHYDLTAKVFFEHADNPLIAILYALQGSPYFSFYLQSISLPPLKPMNTTPIFNPYIHGTNSACLSLLCKTQLTMLAPHIMLEKYQLAPVNGEITKGGHEGVDAKCYPCFGRMNARGMNVYSLQKIIGNYTKFAKSSMLKTEDTFAALQKNSILELNEVIAEGKKCAFSNINVLCIFLARAKQYGCTIDEQKIDLQKMLHGTVQFYYLILLLGKHINFNFDLINQHFNTKELNDNLICAITTHLTFEKILEKIIAQNIDLKLIYNQPTKENLLRAIDVLELPLNSFVKTEDSELYPRDLLIKEKYVALPIHQIFATDQPIFLNTNARYPLKKGLFENSYRVVSINDCSNFGAFAKNHITGNIKYWLKQIVMGNCYPLIFELSQYEILDHIRKLEKKVLLAEKILEKDLSEVRFNSYQKHFLTQSFPMMLICEQEEKIQLLDFNTQEYRAKAPSLKIGKDITLIATDTHSNRLKLMKYFEQHHAFNVTIVLFNDLKKSQDTGVRPESPYTHYDGFPRLTWLSSRKIPSLDSAANNNNNLHETIQQMMENAKVYNGLSFA